MYRPVLEDKSWARNVWDAIGSSWRARWDEEVARPEENARVLGGPHQRLPQGAVFPDRRTASTAPPGDDRRSPPIPSKGWATGTSPTSMAGSRPGRKAVARWRRSAPASSKASLRSRDRKE